MNPISLIFLSVWSVVLYKLNWSLDDCWLENGTEMSFSENLTGIFYFFIFILFLKMKDRKYYVFFAFLALFFSLEEFNYGQNFLEFDYSLLDQDSHQWALHTKLPYYVSAFLSDVLLIFGLFILPFIAFKEQSFLHLIPLFTNIAILFILGYSTLYVPALRNSFECVPGSSEEIMELYLSSIFLYHTILFYLDTKKNPFNEV